MSEGRATNALPEVEGDKQETGKKGGGRRRLVLIGAGALALVCVCLAGLAVLSGGGEDGERTEEPAAVTDGEEEGEVAVVEEEAQPTDAPVPTDSLEPSSTPEPTNTPEPTDTPVPTAPVDPNLISRGTYLVGADIQPGLYYGEAAPGSGSCYWERLSDLSGEFSAIIANGNGVGTFYIEAVEGDHALKVDCPVTYLETLPAPMETFPETIGPGDYLVGITMRPGLYRGETRTGAGDSCYWERRSSFRGDFEAIIANGNGVGPYYIEVAESDLGFHVACEVSYLSELPAPADPFPTVIGPGDYLVGIDIQPGTYRGEAGTEAGESCYWERLSSFSGTFDALVANGNGSGQFFVEVAPGDYALRTACELALTE